MTTHFLNGGFSTTAWVEIMEVGMKFSVQEMGFDVMGFEGTAKYQQWPRGTDFSNCLQCLQSCASSFCPGTGAARCVIQRKCRCPAIIHKLKGGLCGPIVADPSQPYQRWGNPWRELAICVSIGLCVPSGVVWVRQVWKIVWLSVISICFCAMFSRGRRYIKARTRKTHL